jgi:hypothetical protein
MIQEQISVRRIQMILWAEICQSRHILREKEVRSCHIGYSNLAHSSHSSCGSGVHLIHKIEKKREKTMLPTT